MTMIFYSIKGKTFKRIAQSVVFDSGAMCRTPVARYRRGVASVLKALG